MAATGVPVGPGSRSRRTRPCGPPWHLKPRRSGSRSVRGDRAGCDFRGNDGYADAKICDVQYRRSLRRAERSALLGIWLRRAGTRRNLRGHVFPGRTRSATGVVARIRRSSISRAASGHRGTSHAALRARCAGGRLRAAELHRVLAASALRRRRARARRALFRNQRTRCVIVARRRAIGRGYRPAQDDGRDAFAIERAVAGRPAHAELPARRYRAARARGALADGRSDPASLYDGARAARRTNASRRIDRRRTALPPPPWLPCLPASRSGVPPSGSRSISAADSRSYTISRFSPRSETSRCRRRRTPNASGFDTRGRAPFRSRRHPAARAYAAAGARTHRRRSRTTRTARPTRVPRSLRASG